MFSFLKKNQFKVVACASGKCIPLSEVNDSVFSKKMMGDGFAIIPENEMIVSPVDGTIETVFPTKHAIGIKTKDGVEIILHIGLDTVNLNGEGFTSYVKAGDHVKAGQKVSCIDRQNLLDKGYDLSTMVIFTSGYEQEISLPCYNQEVKAGDVLIG